MVMGLGSFVRRTAPDSPARNPSLGGIFRSPRLWQGTLPAQNSDVRLTNFLIPSQHVYLKFI